MYLLLTMISVVYRTKSYLLVAISSLLLGCLFLPAEAQTTTDKLKAKVDSLHKVMADPKAIAKTVTAADTIVVIPDTLKKDNTVTAKDTVPAQLKRLTPSELVLKADSLRLKYDFKEAVDCYRRAIGASADSLQKSKIEEKLILGQNGLSMMDYCSQPVVVSKQKFSLKEFFLFYPLKDLSWRPLPNSLDSDKGSSLVRATYWPDSTKTIYYSAKDEDGIRNIYSTHYKDSLWTAPELLNEDMTSSGDEIYPMMSRDGKSIYFASSGLYGMGGYDLYVTTWNKETKDWNIPVNMGFPYSSPYDDFLFINTDDGKYSIFASNRECSKDSVYLYVLEYDSMPVRKAVSDEQELRKLVSLTPVNEPQRMDNASVTTPDITDNADTKLYMSKMNEVRALRDSISALTNSSSKERAALAAASGAEKERLTQSIIAKETSVAAKQLDLDKAVKALQQIEMTFLAKGVVIDPSKVSAEADKEVVGASTGYTFSKKTMGPPLSIKLQKPESLLDYSFKILPVGKFAESGSMPSGLVYQIKIFTIPSHATVKQIKGLSPVFEKLGPSLRYTYYAGVFKSYKDVLSNLNKVKRIGFRSASIVAFMDGKEISVQQARASEAKNVTNYFLKIYPNDGQTLPEIAVTVVRQQSSKDVARVVEGGVVTYVVGPFESEVEIQPIASALKAAGITNIAVTSEESK